jgi:hypothetical protein
MTAGSRTRALWYFPFINNARDFASSFNRYDARADASPPRVTLLRARALLRSTQPT